MDVTRPVDRGERQPGR